MFNGLLCLLLDLSKVKPDLLPENYKSK